MTVCSSSMHLLDFLLCLVFSLARQHISDLELRQLAQKYHRRHPTFSVDIQERTCKSILLACTYHYRHIQIDLTCQCTYNDILHKFEKQWTTHHPQYKASLNNILASLESTSTYRSLPIQIEMIIELINNYFMELKTIDEQQTLARVTSVTSNRSGQLSVEYFPSEETIRQRRRSLVERSLSCSYSLSTCPARYSSIFDGRKVKNRKE